MQILNVDNRFDVAITVISHTVCQQVDAHPVNRVFEQCNVRRAIAAINRVLTSSADNEIVAATALNTVITSVALQVIVPACTYQDVIAAVAPKVLIRIIWRDEGLIWFGTGVPVIHWRTAIRRIDTFHQADLTRGKANVFNVVQSVYTFATVRRRKPVGHNNGVGIDVVAPTKTKTRTRRKGESGRNHPSPDQLYAIACQGVVIGDAVNTRTPVNAVVAGAQTEKLIVACATVHSVIARTRADGVITITSIDRVVTRRAVDIVVPDRTANEVREHRTVVIGLNNVVLDVPVPDTGLISPDCKLHITIAAGKLQTLNVENSVGSKPAKIGRDQMRHQVIQLVRVAGDRATGIVCQAINLELRFLRIKVRHVVGIPGVPRPGRIKRGIGATVQGVVAQATGQVVLKVAARDRVAARIALHIVLLVRNAHDAVTEPAAIDIVVGHLLIHIRICRRVIKRLRISVFVVLGLQLLPGIRECQYLDIAQHIATITTHGVAVAILDHDKAARIIKRTGHIALGAGAQAKLVIDSGLARGGWSEEADFVAVNAVAVADLIENLPVLSGIDQINGKVAAAVQQVITLASLELVSPLPTEQRVVASATVHPVAIGTETRNGNRGWIGDCGIVP